MMNRVPQFLKFGGRLFLEFQASFVKSLNSILKLNVFLLQSLPATNPFHKEMLNEWGCLNSD